MNLRTFLFGEPHTFFGTQQQKQKHVISNRKDRNVEHDFGHSQQKQFGYENFITRRLAASGIFLASHSCEEGFLKDENVFFSKNYSFVIMFSNFSHAENSLKFRSKNLRIRTELTVLRNITLWYAFHSILATLGFSKKFKFIFEKLIFFQKEPKEPEQFEKSCYLRRNLRRSCYNLVTR